MSLCYGTSPFCVYIIMPLFSGTCFLLHSWPYPFLLGVIILWLLTHNKECDISLFLSNLGSAFVFQNIWSYRPLNFCLHRVHMFLILHFMLHVSIHISNLPKHPLCKQSQFIYFYNLFSKETWFWGTFILCWPLVSLSFLRPLFIFSFCYNYITLLTSVCVYDAVINRMLLFKSLILISLNFEICIVCVD